MVVVSSHKNKWVSLLFGLMLMPKPVLPELGRFEKLEQPPEVSLFATGNPLFCTNEYWLPYEPFREWGSQLCRQPAVGDADGDGFWDLAELELLWAFLPYLVFDNDEIHRDQMVMVYQATPGQRPTLFLGETVSLIIKIIYLFEADTSSCSYAFAEHGGDSEAIALHLEGRRDPQTGEMRWWKLVRVTGYLHGKLDNLESLYMSHCGRTILRSGAQPGVELPSQADRSPPATREEIHRKPTGTISPIGWKERPCPGFLPASFLFLFRSMGFDAGGKRVHGFQPTQSYENLHD